eukprot:gene23273-biopygen4309
MEENRGMEESGGTVEGKWRKKTGEPGIVAPRAPKAGFCKKKEHNQVEGKWSKKAGKNTMERGRGQWRGMFGKWRKKLPTPPKLGSCEEQDRLQPRTPLPESVDLNEELGETTLSAGLAHRTFVCVNPVRWRVCGTFPSPPQHFLHFLELEQGRRWRFRA